MNRREAIEAIKNAEMGPAEKRLALKQLGVEVEYMPHQGKREMARRRKTLEDVAEMVGAGSV